jgi:hypothetical protein
MRYQIPQNKIPNHSDKPRTPTDQLQIWQPTICTMMKIWGSCVNPQQQRIMKSMLWDVYYSITSYSCELKPFNQVKTGCALRSQFRQSCKGNPPSSTKAFVKTECEIEHHEVVCSGDFANEFSDKQSESEQQEHFMHCRLSWRSIWLRFLMSPTLCIWT